MKALVLAGGSGSRLRPITHASAKRLVPVANKPVLFCGLEPIRQAGIEQVGVVVGETAPAIEAAVGDGRAFGLNVTYIRRQAARRGRGSAGHGSWGPRWSASAREWRSRTFTSVGEGCVITGSEIEYSIVPRGASISGAGRIEASLIGRDVEVAPAQAVPRAHRLVLGGHSEVRISS